MAKATQCAGMHSRSMGCSGKALSTGSAWAANWGREQLRRRFSQGKAPSSADRVSARSSHAALVGPVTWSSVSEVRSVPAAGALSS